MKLCNALLFASKTIQFLAVIFLVAVMKLTSESDKPLFSNLTFSEGVNVGIGLLLFIVLPIGVFALFRYRLDPKIKSKFGGQD